MAKLYWAVSLGGALEGDFSDNEREKFIKALENVVDEASLDLSISLLRVGPETERRLNAVDASGQPSTLFVAHQKGVL